MRRWGVALLLAAWVFAVTGCGGGSSSSSGGSGGAASTDKTPVTITLRHPWTGDEKKLFEQALVGFHQKYPWITVKAIGYPDSDTFDQQIEEGQSSSNAAITFRAQRPPPPTPTPLPFLTPPPP